jgi:hypothetical protein
MAWYDHRGLRWLRFLRLELHRQTDILAAAAFFISISGLLYQGVLSIERPDIVQFPPEQILFFPDKSGNVDYVNVGAQLSYINKGKGDKSAVVRLARMVFDLDGETYELKWQTFEEFASNGNQLKRSAAPRPVVPKVIKSGEAFTEEIHFAPRTLPVVDQSDFATAYKDFLPWDRFVSDLANLKEFDVRIISEFYGLHDQQTKIFIRITPALIQSLKADKWSAPSCWVR